MAPSKTVAKQGTAPQFEVDPDQALKASKALLAHIKKTASENAANATKKNLLDDADEEKPLSVAETPIWMTVTTKRHIHDSKKLQPSKIILPHPLNDDPEATICIIVADPQRYYKNLVASEEFSDSLRNRITRVIDIKHLQAKFKQYEAQRNLYSEHDIFLADDRIINRLPKALGKSFYKNTTKRPIPIVLQAKKPRENGTPGKKVKKNPEEVSCRPTAEVVGEIEKAIGAALVHLSPSSNTAVKVGYASLEPKALSENIVKAANEMANKFVPKTKNGVKSIFIKGPETVALPIWQDSELWLDATADVIANDSELAKAIEAKKEQANVGKKRKTLNSADEEPSAKKAKKEDVPEGDDDKLDKQIASRKTKLRSAKAKAKSALED
ncbi:proteasome-interacting protein cic1 [Gnomoniopsis smithogilvyi]|uniref:Proteasome-interacting protein cic1 n=1 Tax=Gnomoniopsis smithogilvyi TaxID=1191159 RepID=A0A9W9CWZ7_9PEZI|nr:proteasome-interacting protein cic1 [Gnomoniopsis smithogilvyi]